MTPVRSWVMACGTPVIAFPAGSVPTDIRKTRTCNAGNEPPADKTQRRRPEVIDEGVSGYLVRDVAEAVLAVQRVASFDRAKAGACFESRFTIGSVARDYVNIYRSLPGVRIAGPRVRVAASLRAPVAPTVSVFGEVPRPRPLNAPALARLPLPPAVAAKD